MYSLKNKPGVLKEKKYISKISDKKTNFTT